MPPFRPTTIANLAETTKEIPPNRLTTIFTRMRESCPHAIRLYANCVSKHHSNGTLEKGICDAEFQSVKECFRQSRR